MSTRIVTSGECPDVEVYLIHDRLRGVVHKLRGQSPGVVFYVWRGWFEERVAGPCRSPAEATRWAREKLFGETDQ